MRKLTVQNVLGVSGLITILGGAILASLLAFGFRLETPAGVAAEHIEEFHNHTATFEGHVAHIDTFVAQYEASELTKAVSRAQRTLMVEAQTKLTCLTIGADTLVMLDLISVCDDLGVER